MEYKIIEISKYGSVAKKIHQLEEAVNKAISEGWVPQGGVFMTANQVFQTMIRD
jgi:hypothetical protein|tara:strand:- start:72 stop:233 length:162 start_codon:yes stop_codon:yes gene_type:complete